MSGGGRHPWLAAAAGWLIEERVLALGGIKSLYSESFFDRETFDRIYGGEAYRTLKAKYDPDGAFPELYDKIKPEVDVLAVLDEEKAWLHAAPAAIHAA